MNFLVKNFIGFLVVTFLFVALGQWNHPKFQEKAYDQAKEMIMLDLAAKGGENVKFIESPDLSSDIIHAAIVTEDGTEYLYDVSITNPVLVQLSALNLFVTPKVQIVDVKTSKP